MRERVLTNLLVKSGVLTILDILKEKKLQQEKKIMKKNSNNNKNCN